MSGTQVIYDYASSQVDASRFRSGTNYITNSTLKDEFNGWLSKRTFSHGVQYSGRPVDTSSTDWVANMKRKMAERIVYKIEKEGETDWNNYDGKTIGFETTSKKDKDMLGSGRYKPWEDSYPTLRISKFCTSMAVVRALLFHELIEVFVCVRYIHGYAWGTYQDAHDTAYKIVKQFRMEDQSEKLIRLSNLVRCYYELKYIAEKLIEKQKKTGLSNYGLFDTILDIFKVMKSGLFIPGYYEDYTIGGYKKTDKSNIGQYFQRAKDLGIYPERISFARSQTLKGERGSVTVNLA